METLIQAYLLNMTIRLSLFILLIINSRMFTINAQLDSLLNNENILAISKQYYTFTKSNKNIIWANYKSKSTDLNFPILEKQVALHMFGDSSLPENVKLNVESISGRKISFGNSNNPQAPDLIFRTTLKTPDFSFFINLGTNKDTTILNISDKLPHDSIMKYNLTDLCIKVGIDYLNSITIDDYEIDYKTEFPFLIHQFKCDRVEKTIIKNKSKMSGVTIDRYTLIRMNSYTGEITITNEKKKTHFAHMNIDF